MSINFFFPKIARVMKLCGTTWRSRTCHRRQCGTYASYGYKHTLRIRNNYWFSAAPRLYKGAAMLSFTYTAFVVCYYNNMTGKSVKYVLMSSESRIVTRASIFFW